MSWEVDREEPIASAWEVDAEEPIAKQPRRGGVRSEVKPYVADGEMEPERPKPGSSVLDTPGHDPNRDPLIRQEFVDQVRDSVARTDPAERLGALEQMAAGNNARARAAREVLRQLKLERVSQESIDAAQAAGPLPPQDNARVAKFGKLPPSRPGRAGQTLIPDPTPQIRDLADGTVDPAAVAKRRMDEARFEQGVFGTQAQIATEASATAKKAREDAEKAKYAPELFGDSILGDAALNLSAGGARMLQMGAAALQFLTPAETAYSPYGGKASIERFGKSAKDAAEWFTGARSTAAREATERTSKVYADPNADALDVLGAYIREPHELSKVILESMAMAGPVGGAARGFATAIGVAGLRALKAAPATPAVAARLAELQTKGATAAAIGGEALLGAGGVYQELKDAGKTDDQAAIGAAVAAVGYVIVGKFTGGGAEGELARGKTGLMPRAMAKEGAEEIGQSFAESAGKVAGDQDMTLNEAAKDAAVSGLAGTAVGGGVNAGMRASARAGTLLEGGPGQQFARALQQDIDSQEFAGDPARYAAAALDPRAHDPGMVDPRDTVRAPGALPAAMAEGSAIPSAGPASDTAVVQPAAPVVSDGPPRVEEMPPEILPPEAFAAAGAKARETSANMGASSDLSAAPLGGEAAVGVANVQQGALAAAADEALRQRATGAGSNDSRGGAADAGVGAGRVDAGVQPSGGVEPPGSGDAAPGAGVATAGAAPQPAAATGADAGADGAGPALADSRTDDQIRADFTARYGQRRSEAEAAAQRATTAAARTRKRAEALRKSAGGSKTILKRAAEMEAQADQTERGAQDALARVRAHTSSLAAPPPELAASFAPLQKAVQDAFGRRVVAYHDEQDDADGFAQDGVAFVNLAKAERSVPFTVFHEVQHLVRKEAKAGSKDAQLATRMLDEVWGMISQDHKRAYAKGYLFRRQLEAGETTIEAVLQSETLRDEMLSDFMGKRATDEEFLSGLAQRNPQQFKSFATRWIASLGKLIDALLGSRNQDRSKPVDRGGYKDIDLVVKDLSRAKAVAEKVLRAWADSRPVAKQESERSDSARTVYEAAPDPKDKQATAEWEKKPLGEKRRLTYDTDSRVFDRVAKAVGVDPAGLGEPIRTLGGYLGHINPSIVRMAGAASDEDIVSVSAALGYVYNQDAVLAVLRAPVAGSNESGSIVIEFDRELDEPLARRAYDAIMADKANAWVVGFTGRGATMEIVSVGGAITDEMLEGVRAALDAADIEANRSIARSTEPLHVVFVDKGKYGQDQGAAAGQPDGGPVRPGDLATLDRIRREVTDALGRPDAAGGAPDGAARAGGARPAPEQQGARYGAARAGATSVLAFHYSHQSRTTLTGDAYGMGLAGAEMARVAGDPLLSKRIYFYFDKGTGIRPESGVGGYGHRVQLDNLYDLDSDELRLARDSSGGLSGMERAIAAAGFDGYLVRNEGEQSGVAVLIGRHTVQVDPLGPTSRLPSEKPLPAAKPRVLKAYERIAASKALPSGQMAGSRWARIVKAVMPAEFAEYEGHPVWSSDEAMYRDELAGRLSGRSNSAREDSYEGPSFDSLQDNRARAKKLAALQQRYASLKSLLVCLTT